LDVPPCSRREIYISQSHHLWTLHNPIDLLEDNLWVVHESDRT